MYSKWLNARGLFALAGTILNLNIEDFSGDAEQLRHALVGAIKDYRRQIGQGVIAEFSAQSYNPYITFARCGHGSLGGKARGLAFVASIIENHNLYHRWPSVMLTIPRTLAICSGYFDQFIAQNDLEYMAQQAHGLSDSDILAEFVAARLPEQLIEELAEFLAQVNRPLAVRSSSKLEDSHYQPFAGVYNTYMIARNTNPSGDLRRVGNAIKSVYASVFFAASRAYIDSTSNVVGEESMGVVIQEICGTSERGLYFPTISGVAQSLNFYPLEGERAGDGVCKIALGLGKTVVEGGVAMRFSPAQPRGALQLSTMELTLRDTQRQFYALDLDPLKFRTTPNDSLNLTTVEVQGAHDFRNMQFAASWWDMQNNRMLDSRPFPADPNNHKAPRPYITFAQVLKYNTFPLAEILQTLLEIGQQEIKSPIEIEFAVNMDVAKGEPMVFNLLQIRPMVSANRGDSLDWSGVDTAGALIYSPSALGVGRVQGVRHVAYVPALRFDAAHTPEIAVEVEHINEMLGATDQRYILVGPGRWGSSDSWLGVPVRWAQISHSAVIVESAVEGFVVDASQGTHFFQNLTSLGVGYLNINSTIGKGNFDQARLDAMPAVWEGQFVRCVEMPEELYIFVDGRHGKAIIR